MHLEVRVVNDGHKVINVTTGEELIVSRGCAVVIGRLCYVTQEDYSAIKNSKDVVEVKHEH